MLEVGEGWVEKAGPNQAQLSLTWPTYKIRKVFPMHLCIHIQKPIFISKILLPAVGVKLYISFDVQYEMAYGSPGRVVSNKHFNVE